MMDNSKLEIIRIEESPNLILQAKNLLNKISTPEYSWLRDNQSVYYAISELATAIGYDNVDAVSKKLNRLVSQLVEFNRKYEGVDTLIEPFRVEPNSKVVVLNDLLSGLPSSQTDLFATEAVVNLQKLIELRSFLVGVTLPDIDAVDSFLLSNLDVDYLKGSYGNGLRPTFLLIKKTHDLIYRGYVAVIAENVNKLSTYNIYTPEHKRLLADTKELLGCAQQIYPGAAALRNQRWTNDLANYFMSFGVNGVNPDSYEHINTLIDNFELDRDSTWD